MSGIIYVNGKLLPEEEAQISVFDRSYLYGEGVFEMMRAYNGKVAFSDLHYHRMRDNCNEIRIDLPLDQCAFEKAVARTLQANQMRDAFVRITASPVGPSMGLFRPPRTDTNMVIYCGSLEDRKISIYKQGNRLLLLQTVTAEIGRMATLKTTNYLVRMLGRIEAQAANADDGLFRNAAGYVTEGAASNIFLVKDDVLITPPVSDGLLPGITRDVVISLAEEQNIKCREDHVTLDMLKNSDEIFTTSTTTEIVPTREIVGVTTKAVIPGPVTYRLMNAYHTMLP